MKPAYAGALSTTVTSTGDPEIHELELTFNNLMLKQRESTLNEIAMREGTLQAQLSALQMQINPHFVYNTLNIISAKSMESGNYDVIEICDQFAQMLRYSTDTRSRTATMAEELENARYYLMLSKARYEDNLEFTIDVPENLTSLTVPKLTLQPLVENALSHGFNGANALRKLWLPDILKRPTSFWKSATMATASPRTASAVSAGRSNRWKTTSFPSKAATATSG